MRRPRSASEQSDAAGYDDDSIMYRLTAVYGSAACGGAPDGAKGPGPKTLEAEAEVAMVKSVVGVANPEAQPADIDPLANGLGDSVMFGKG